MKIHSSLIRYSLAFGILAVSAVNQSLAAGLVNFANSATTLISANPPFPGYGNLMPPQSVQTFYFAVFLASSTTVTGPGQNASLLDVHFQLASGYNTNHSSVVGRIFSRPGLDVGTAAGFSAGEPVDFLVRGWSANLGDTWEEARNNWLGMTTSDGLMPWMGSSVIGNDFYLGGGAFPSSTLFGSGDNQIGGFTLYSIPEPTSLSMLALGVGIFAARRHQRNRN